jgi:hypothetical protein
MPSVKLFDDVLTKNVAHTSVIVAPSLNIDLWVRPEQIAQQASVWHFLWTVLKIYNLEVV